MRNGVEYQDESCIKLKIIKTAWSTREDNLLKKGIKMCGMNWIAIAEYVQKQQLFQLYPIEILTNVHKDGRDFKGRGTNQFWNSKEDQLLLQLIQQYGKKWSKIAQIIKNRNSKQCRNRFVNSLDPNLKQNGFTKEEDQLIYQKYLEYGSKWSQISKFLVGTITSTYYSIDRQYLNLFQDNQIKNRFYNNIRSQYLQIQNPYYSKQTQSQPKEFLEQVREEHLRINGTYEKGKIIEYQNDMQTKDQDISRYVNEENYSNFDQSLYSNRDFEYLSTSHVNLL